MTTTRKTKTPAPMTHRTLRTKIAALPATSSATAKFTAAVVKANPKQKERAATWYTSQQQHWLGWLAEMDGAGFYGRQVGAPPTAAQVYGRIVNPAMLVWLGEASGLDVAAAVAAALKKNTMAGMAGAIRKALPWSVVEAALKTR